MELDCLGLRRTTGAQRAWDGWAKKTPEAKALVEAHRTFLRRIGKIK